MTLAKTEADRLNASVDYEITAEIPDVVDTVGDVTLTSPTEWIDP